MSELERLKEENNRLKEELDRIRKRCKHPKSYIIKKYDLAGDYEHNSVVYRCPDCGLEFEGLD